MDISHVDTSKSNYRARNIEEAVEIAHQLKADGEFDWFRGQVREEWLPLSSLARVRAGGDRAAFEKAIRRATIFFHWLDEISELKYLREPQHVNDFFAIMQHHGIPTDYLDFTTDPGIAAFFAADTNSPPTDALSCIYCLDSDDLMKMWNILATLEARTGAEMERVEIDVQNLWRLQAQRGVFLRVNYNWHIDYGMFKIIFPYSGYPSYPTRGKIYPEDKSSLEQLLDQYFDVERATFLLEEMEERFEAIRSRGGNAEVSHWKPFPQGFYAPAFVDAKSVNTLSSWNEDKLNSWKRPSIENYHDAQGRTVKLTLNPAGEIGDIRRSVVFGINQFLRSEANSRSKTLSWAFDSLPEKLTAKELDDVLRRVWNGMRLLPYEDSDIAEACGSVAALLMTQFYTAGSEEQRTNEFSECFGSAIQVAFAHMDGSGSRGYATRESILAALRPDMADLLTPEFKPLASDAHDVFRIIYNPQLMFDFDKLKELFAQEVIPSQAALKRNLILFNPARLQTFGLP